MIDGHVWTPNLNNLTSKNSGCPKCSNNGRPTEEQALNICKDLCDKEGYTDVVFPNGYSNATNTRLEYKCPIHGLQNTSYVSFVNGGKRCKECGVIKSRENQKIPAHEALNNCKIICDVMGYRPIGFVDGYINAITTEFEYECPIHGIQKVRYNKFVNSGYRCPSCSVSGYSVEKPGSFYVVRWTRGVHSFIKFGITNQSIKDRISQQARYTEYSHEIIYSQTWEDGKIAAILERRIKYNSTLNIGVIDKQYFEDGFTETIDLKELDILLEYVRIYLAEFHKGEIMEKKSALDIQIDGQHYKNQKIQPIELAYKLGGTPAFCKLAKYLTREKNDKKVNLQKAYHCICLEEDLSVFADIYYIKDHDNFYNERWYVEELVEDFSDNEMIRSALIAMYTRDYSSAKQCVNYYAIEVLGTEVGE